MNSVTVNSSKHVGSFRRHVQIFGGIFHVTEREIRIAEVEQMESAELFHRVLFDFAVKHSDKTLVLVAKRHDFGGIPKVIESQALLFGVGIA